MYFELSGLQMANGFYGLVHTQHIYTQTVNKPSYTTSQSNLPKPAYLTLLSNFTMSIRSYICAWPNNQYQSFHVSSFKYKKG